MYETQFQEDCPSLFHNSLMIAIGIFLAYFLAEYRAERIGLDAEAVFGVKKEIIFLTAHLKAQSSVLLKFQSQNPSHFRHKEHAENLKLFLNEEMEHA